MPSSNIRIHPTAIVDPGAVLGDGVVIGPYSIVDKYVTIGEGTEIGTHCVVTGRTVLGKRNRIFTGAVVGSEPQDVKFHGESTSLEIGDDNVIREHATVNPGTGEGSKTVIGNGTWLMVQAHVGHNCVIGDNVKLVNLVTLGGHVVVEDYATVGGLTPVHQYARIGCYSMVGGGFRAVQDVLPYMMAGDEPLRIIGLNQVGLERNGFTKETIDLLKQAHRIIFRKNLTVKEAVSALTADLPQTVEIKHLVEFLGTSTRGIVR